MCNIIEFNMRIDIGLKIRIKKLKLELIELAEKKNTISDKEVIKKSQELDELIVLYTEKKYLVG